MNNITTKTSSPAPPHPQRRSIYFHLALASIGGLILALIVVLFMVEKNAASQQRQAAIDRADDIAQSLQLILRGNGEYIRMLAIERARGTLSVETFDRTVAPFLESHRELINITWVDARFLIVDVSPRPGNEQIIGLHLELPEPKLASLLAKETRTEAYTRSFEAIQSLPSFEIWVPVYRGDEFLGLFAGVYSCAKLLDRAIEHVDLSLCSVTLKDSSGGILARSAANGGPGTGPAAALPLDPPGHGVHVIVQMTEAGTLGWSMIILIGLCAILLLGVGYELRKLRLEIRRREETEGKLRTEQDLLKEVQERLNFALEGTNDGIWDVWLTTGQVYLSPRGCEILGYKADELAEVILVWNDLVHPDDLPLTQERLSAHLQGLEPVFIVEQRLRMKSGEWKWILSRGKVVMRDESGAPLRITGTHTDIDERKQIEEELAESEEKYRTLIEVSSDAIFINRGMAITYLNRAAVRLFGAAGPEQIIGKSPLELFHPDYHQLIRSRMTELQNNQPVPLVEEKIVRLDGTIVDVEVAATSFSYKGKRAIQVVLRDITDRKRLEAHLVQSQKLEGLGTLAGGVAHDFNNILSAMLGTAENLRSYVQNQPKALTYVNKIIDAAERGGSIAKQLLLFSRQSEITLKMISVSHIIEEVKTMLRHFIPKTVTVTSDIEVNNGLINGDAGHVHQIILNLCLNAKDAIGDHGHITIKERTVDAAVVAQRFSANVSGAFVAISVTDNGTGIDESLLPKIFDPFFTTKEKGKGTGLGLSIVDGLVRSHNGFIDVVSKKGEGSTFTVYFPAVHQKEEAVLPEAASVSLKGKRILLADDEQDIRLALVDYLTSLEADVLVAADGIEALEAFTHSELPIDLVITDLGMPRMNGEALVHALRKLDPSIPVIVSSGYLDGWKKEELVQSGVVEVLQKPYRFKEIRKILVTLFGSDPNAPAA